jgi:hypothetical protein
MQSSNESFLIPPTLYFSTQSPSPFKGEDGRGMGLAASDPIPTLTLPLKGRVLFFCLPLKGRVLFFCLPLKGRENCFLI